MYPDIDKYEEEELAFHEDEKNRNKQIQASIAQIFQRQAEALTKRRTPARDAPSAFVARSQRNYRNTLSRRKRNSRGTEIQVSDENEDENDNDANKNSSSNDEQSPDNKPRRYKRRRSTQPSTSAAITEGGFIENETEAGRESRGISPGLVWNPEMLAWGRGGARSHTRHGSGNGASSKSARSNRFSKLAEYLRALEENDDELDVHLMLISLDKESTPSLQQPYLCCRPSLSVGHLCEYVSLQTQLQVEEVEILVIRECQDTNGTTSVEETNAASQAVKPCKTELQFLEAQKTLADIKASCTSSRDQLILAYRRKEKRASKNT